MGVELVEFVIPGAEVRARPVKDAGRADVIVRIENVFAHGTDHRYNLEVTPLVEGIVDLRDHLERIDGTPLGEEVPEIRILVDAVTDADMPFPVDPDVPHPGRVGGYTNLMMGPRSVGVGLVSLIFSGVAGVARRGSSTIAAPGPWPSACAPSSSAPAAASWTDPSGRSSSASCWPTGAEAGALGRERRGGVVALRADAEAGPCSSASSCGSTARATRSSPTPR